MVRFQNVLGRIASGDSPDWAALAAELGYADQSHLIRDFSAFAQLSPGALRAPASSA
jgi:AraC-like DNA-binding protein